MNRRIFSAMITVGVLTAVSKGVSVSKDLATAYVFGAGDALDAFLIAWLVPSFAINLVSGSLNAALIPTYIQVWRQEGESAAQRLFASTMVCNMLLVLTVAMVLSVSGHHLLPMVASGFDPEKLAFTESLYQLLLPCLFLTGMATTWHALLNARERFAVASLTPVISTGITTILILLLGQRVGIVALAGGVVVGFLAEASVLGWRLAGEGVSVLPRWHGVTTPLKQVWMQYIPMLAGAFMMGGTEVIGQSLAARLGPGSNAVLSYASKLPTLVVGIGTFAVSTAVLPYFSQLAAAGDSGGLRRTLWTYCGLIALVTVPTTLLLILFSDGLVYLLFQRGEFSTEDAARVAAVQVLYLLQIPFFSVGILAVRLISALRANQVLMWSSAMNLLVSAVLTYTLIQWLSVAGIALATSLTYVLSMVYLLFMASRLITRMEQSRVSPSQS
jgi:putative peptidoglycan lipid II flippase